MKCPVKGEPADVSSELLESAADPTGLILQ
jgi:hypothetical protein